MVEPLSLAIGAGVALVVAAAVLGIYLSGRVAALRPDHVVDMRVVSNYYRHQSAHESLSSDVEDQ